MPNELIMRGKTADFKTTGALEVLNFSGHKEGYAFQLVEFKLYPSLSLGTQRAELCGSVTAEKTAADPENPNFDNEGLIATALLTQYSTTSVPGNRYSVVNDMFLITQDLILTVADTEDSNPINWQLKFRKVKLSSAAEAVANFNQFTIFDG